MARLTLAHQQLLQNFTDSICFGSVAMFSGGFFSMNDDNSQFDEKRTKYLNDQHYHRSESDAKRLITLTTSDRAFQAYEACLKSLPMSSGLLVWASKISMSSIILEVKYINPPGTRNVKLSSVLVGGKVAGVPTGQLWRQLSGTNFSKTVIIEPIKGNSSHGRTIAWHHDRPRRPRGGVWLGASG